MSEEAQAFINMLSADKEDLGYDVETNGLNWKDGFVCGYGLSDGNYSFYVPVRHGGGFNIEGVEAFEREVAKIIDKRKHKLIAHNAKFDAHFSANHGIYIAKKVVDTMVREALLNEHRSSYSLKNSCKRFPDIEQKNDKVINEYLANKFNVPVKGAMGCFYKLVGNDEIGISYAKSDNIAVKQLYEKQNREIALQNLDVVDGLEKELTYVLWKMERKGIKINLNEVETLKREIEKDLLAAYSEIPLGEDLTPINVKSNKDLQQYFEYCQIEDWPLTAKGNPSFNKLFLAKSSEGEIILQARKLDHFTSSFLNPLDVHIFNGRIHCRFNQAIGEFGGVRFGRLSCGDPNMQQVPKRDKVLGKKFRRIFISDDDFYYVELDYSQAEPRLFTHYSGEPSLMRGYNSKPYIDMHSIAAELMHIERSVAKNLNLGIMYTMGAAKLANQLGITYDEAKDIVSQWYKTFKKVSGFTRDAAKVAEVRGFVKTILGRRARFPDPRFSYRAANRIVQGGSADILKWKIVEINRWIEANNYDEVVHILLNIHDSIVLQVHKDYFHLIEEIKKIMEDVQVAPFNLKVPFVVEHEEPALNWSDATYGIKKAA